MNSIMEYNGYHAKISFSNEDETFIGEVLGLKDSLVFEGETVEELKEMFHASIDDYLDYCAHIGKEPEKEFKGSFNIRIPPDLHRQAYFEAERRDISLNQFVQEAIEYRLLEKEPIKETIRETTYVLTVPMGERSYQLQGNDKEYIPAKSQEEKVVVWNGSSFTV